MTPGNRGRQPERGAPVVPSGISAGSCAITIPKPVFQILLAEDNPGDVRLLREALKTRGLACDLTVAEDGQKAVTLLDQAARGQAGLHPHLIILDVNLPKRNGDAVLTHIRAEAAFDSVPVIVLTSSTSPTDRARALELGANLYLQKSSDLKQLMDLGRIIESMLLGSGEAAADKFRAD